MFIPEFKKYQRGEYSLIQISPTLDSSELINIGVIVKNLETKEIKFKEVKMEDFDKDKKVRIATKTGNLGKNAKPFNAESLKKG